MTENDKKLTTSQFLFFEKLASTNSKLKEICDKKPLPEFSIVLAKSQYAGRGQQGNTWESEPRKNLTFSLVIYPSFIRIQDQFIISQWISVAIIKALSKYIKDGLKIKWPNDIYVGDKKIGGILIENTIVGAHLERTVVGIGININQISFTSPAPNPISLIQIIHETSDLNMILNQLLDSMGDEYSKLIEGNVNLIQQDYLINMYHNDGQCYTYKDNSGIFNAQISGIDNYGRLKLLRESGEISVYEFKEVEYLR